MIAFLAANKDKLTKEEKAWTLDELLIAETMQERKIIMQQKADAFIVMSGGLGTWKKHLKPGTRLKIGVLNKPIGLMVN